MKRYLLFTGVATSVLAASMMTGCGGSDRTGTTDEGSARPGSVATAAPTQTMNGRQQLSGHLSPEVLQAPSTSPVDPATTLTLVFGLPVQKPEAIRTAVQAVSDPESPSYRKYMTPEAFGEKYGASVDDYQRLVDWAKSKNFTVTTHANRLVITASAPAADVEAALQIHLVHALRPDGTEFFKPDVEPSMDLSLPVEHISGLENYVVEHHASGTGQGGNYSAGCRSLSASCSLT